MGCFRANLARRHYWHRSTTTGSSPTPLRRTERSTRPKARRVPHRQPTWMLTAHTRPHSRTGRRVPAYPWPSDSRRCSSCQRASKAEAFRLGALFGDAGELTQTCARCRPGSPGCLPAAALPASGYCRLRSSRTVADSVRLCGSMLMVLPAGCSNCSCMRRSFACLDRARIDRHILVE
jgi:hypothetical protein